ncbi:MAG TPA: DNA repair protein RecO [Candidatus Onthovivens sp.]|nr:DNA repair protein RecO [Candidatus Onthovivens sp.]
MFFVKGLVLASYKYRDYDLMCKVLTEKGVLSCKIVGALRKNNKNNYLANKFTIANLELYRGGHGGYKIKTGETLKTYINIFTDYKALYCLNFMTEISLRAVILEDFDILFQAIERYLDLLEEGFSHIIIALCYLVLVFESTGYKDFFETCYSCGEKRPIVGYSKVIESFVCEHCFMPNQKKFDETELKIYNFFKNKEFLHPEKLDITEAEAKKAFEFFYNVYTNIYITRLQSVWLLLEKSLQL